MPYTPPAHLSDGFTCPLCNFHAHQLWFKMYYGPHAHDVTGVEKLELSRCERCNEYLLWFDKKVIFPVVNNVPPPRQDMPEDVKKIYEEAKGILFRSTRASAALLRTAVGVLVDEIVGENKNSLNHNIGLLVEQKKLSTEIQQSLEYLRVIGDHYLHPGVIQMENIEEDDYEHTVTLFESLNLIVDELITRPKRAKTYFDRLPQRQKEQIEKRNGKPESK